MRVCGYTIIGVYFESLAPSVYAALFSLGLLLCSTEGRSQGVSQMAPVVTIVAIQDSEGETEADLTPTYLKRLETWSVETTRRKISQSLARSGQDPKDAYRMRITSNSLISVVGGQKLAIIRITLEDSIREVSVMSFKGGQLYRIGCLRESNHDIPIFSGECGKVLRETLGVTLR